VVPTRARRVLTYSHRFLDEVVRRAPPPHRVRCRLVNAAQPVQSHKVVFRYIEDGSGSVTYWYQDDSALKKRGLPRLSITNVPER